MEFFETGLADMWDYSNFMQDPNLIHDLQLTPDEWSFGKDSSRTTMSVVLKDRLMTDAALGGPRPIKTEHNYSMLSSNSPQSPELSEASQHIPNSIISSSVQSQASPEKRETVTKIIRLQTRIDDMEEECYPAISLDTASGRLSASPPPSAALPPLTPEATATTPTSNDPALPPPASSDLQENCSVLASPSDLNKSSLEIAEELSEFIIKGEPISEPNSPESSFESPDFMKDSRNSIAMISPRHIHFNEAPQPSESEEDDEEYYGNMEMEFENQKIESTTNRRETRQGLPPTPPSSASSDSEGLPSASCSPEYRNIQNSTHVHNIRGYLNSRLYVSASGHSTRQPIHTSLISCQPKGSTGSLVLTEEEKRTLVAEGYPIPTKMPLTKQEEKFLKKVRRKIKNKISAQESRRKKKEYMDGLERRVTILTNENLSYKHRLTTLEDMNNDLIQELNRLKSMINQSS